MTTEFRSMCNCKDVQEHAPYMENARSNGIWLPTQEQVQEMCHQYCRCDFRLLQDFYYWCAIQRRERIKIVRGRTFDELWIMFYM